MRLSVLAEEAIAQGFECVFVGMLGGIDWVQSRIAEMGMAIYESTPSDIEMNSEDYILILDSYNSEVHREMLKEIKWNKVVVIADPQTPLWNADLTIHPGLEGDWYPFEKSRFLYGANFALIRKSIKRRHAPVRSKVKEIVVFGGGTDAFGFAASVTKLLSEIEGFEHVSVFGKSIKRTETIFDNRFEVIPFGRSLDKIIDEADLVFTSASTSSLEIVARGIPLGVVRSAINQEVYYEALGQAGLAAQIGYFAAEEGWCLDREEVERLLADSGYREQIVNTSEGIIDFGGAARILKAISELF